MGNNSEDRQVYFSFLLFCAMLENFWTINNSRLIAGGFMMTKGLFSCPSCLKVRLTYRNITYCPLVNKGNLSSARLLTTRKFWRAPLPPLTTITTTLLLHLPRCSFWAEKFLYIILFMAIPVEALVAERLITRTADLEVRGSSPAPRRAVSFDKEL